MEGGRGVRERDGINGWEELASAGWDWAMGTMQWINTDMDSVKGQYYETDMA